MVFLAALCVLLGVLPTYMIPALSRQLQPWTDSSADALVPPFFASNPAHNTLPPAFVEDFHNLGAQVGQNVLPGRGLVVLHRGGTENPVVFAMSTSYMLVALVVLLVAHLCRCSFVADAPAGNWSGERAGTAACGGCCRR